MGTPTEYAAAWRRIVDIFRERGVTNVAWVWTMMAWSFDPRSGRDAMSYWPGDSYIDFVGSDGYCWYPGRAGDKWNSFQPVFTLTNAFAVAHNKPWMAVEYGAQEDPAVPGRKAQWISDILPTAKAWPALKGLLYFDMTKLYPWDTDSSASSMAAYRALSLDPYMRPAFTLSPTPSPAPSVTPAPSPSPSPIAVRPSPSPSPVPSPSHPRRGRHLHRCRRRHPRRAVTFTGAVADTRRPRSRCRRRHLHRCRRRHPHRHLRRCRSVPWRTR